MLILEEEKYYPFKISDKIRMPDGEVYFKLTDPNRIRHLLRAQWYEKYNLKTGDTITCHIDKINCSGRIFIEPLHPFYKPDGMYDFEIVELKDDTAFVKDAFDNIIEIPVEDIPFGNKVGDKVSCRVLSIKKGKPLLVPASSEPDYSLFKAGEQYSFEVTGYKKYAGNNSYFILSDKNGNSYPLRRKFYEGYGIKTGDTIKCVYKKSGDKSYFEPEHPYYKKGKEYEFFIIGEDVIYKYPDGKEEAIVLLNDYGKEILISRKDVSPVKLESDKITCVVRDIVKGQLILDC